MTWLSLSKPALYGWPSEIPCVVMKSLSAWRKPHVNDGNSEERSLTYRGEQEVVVRVVRVADGRERERLPLGVDEGLVDRLA